MSSERAELIEQVLAGGRVLSTATVLFHTAIAESMGMSPVETKTVDFLDRLGPLTPKELTRHSGLAPASVTALVDRLERRGVVRRVPHPDDRRRVLVELNREQLGVGSQWDYLLTALVELCDRYDDHQLRAIVDFVIESAEITHNATVKLTE